MEYLGKDGLYYILGTSSITKGGKSIKIDGSNDGVLFNDTDPFYLDGQRLIYNQGEYKTESLSAIKIKKVNTNTFTVHFTDGRVSTYKKIGLYDFLITQISDAFGNTIKYEYFNDGNITYLNKISYGDNLMFYIKFLYHDKTYSNNLYANGNKFSSKKILVQIKSGANNSTKYERIYKLTHDISSQKKYRLKEVEITNNFYQSLKKLKFSYNSDSSSRKIIETSDNITGFSSNTLSLGSIAQGDFFGDGKLSNVYVANEGSESDPRKENYSQIIHEKLGKIGQYKFDRNLSLNTGKILEENGKLSENDYLLFFDNFPNNVDQLEDGDVYTYELNALNLSNNKIYKKKFSFYFFGATLIEFNTLFGDFNNDGLIDVLIFKNNTFSGQFTNEYQDYHVSEVFFYEIGKEIKNKGDVDLTNYSNSYKIAEGRNYGEKFRENKVYPIIFNQDGSSDFFILNDKIKKFDIRTLRKNKNGNYSFDIKLNNQNLPDFQEGNVPVFGDFNGDGLTDFMYPKKLYDISKSDAQSMINEMRNDKKIWVEFINNGKGFNVKQRDFTEQNLIGCKQTSNDVFKRPSFWQALWSGNKHFKNLYSESASCGVIATDFNGDGISDFITINKFKKYINDNNTYYLKDKQVQDIGDYDDGITNSISFVENITSTSESFDLKVLYKKSILHDDISAFSFLTLNNSDQYLENSLSGIQFFDPLKNKVKRIEVLSDDFLETQISKVNNGSGVITNIEYTPMTTDIIFPNKDKKSYSGKNLYYSVDRSISDHLKYPFYVNIKQSGFYLVNKITTTFDEHAITKEYRYTNAVQDFSGKGFLGFQKIAESNPYESKKVENTYLPKQVNKIDVLWSVNKFDPLQENQLIEKSFGNLNATQFITKSSIKYKKITDGYSYKYEKEEEINDDNLRDFSILKSYSYNEKGLLISSTTDYRTDKNLKSKEIFTYEPDFSNGIHLFSGKIKEHQTIYWDNSDSFSTKNKYLYDNSNGNIIKKEQFGNNTSPIVTEYKYDNVGNKIEETLSGQGINSLTTKFEYDSTKRFVTKTISPEAKEQTSTVDLKGNPLTVTSYLGLKTSYNYDNWGNNIEVINPYGIKTILVKQQLDNGNYSLSNSTPGVPSTIVVYDKFDRIIQQKKQSINNKWIIVDFEYDIFGKKIKESDPYFEGHTKKWNISEYDALDRIKKVILSNGKEIKTFYKGLGVSVDEGNKKTYKLYNSAGQIVKHTDKGGSITYDYYPNGTLKSSNYDGIIINVIQDGWGNKIGLNDPSAGKYSYKYDPLGNILEEIYPKGKTSYFYDNFYKLIKQNVSSDDNSAIQINYEYNPTTLLPTKTYGESNGKKYEYETIYDEFFRIKGKKETTNNFIYESYLTYNSQNKVKDTSLKTTIKAINKSVNSKVTNIYDDNGFLVEERDAINNRLIKKVNEVNAQNQVKQLDFGNNLGITTSYDKDFFPSQINLTNKWGDAELKIDYSFNSKRNLLEKRNIQFKDLPASNEVFKFDALDRLTEEKENGSIINSYVYDPKGRMVYNSEIGKYNYNDNNYKIESIDFNAKGGELIENRGFHQIKFNSYKQPTDIYLKGKDRISYDFNLFKERSIAYYGNEEEDKNKRPYRKYYTADKKIEIQFDGNDYKIITYIDGDPYSSNYIQIDEIIRDNQTKNNYFLHRDIQGTILAISSTDGILVEKRIFDAWGNIKQVVHRDGSINKTLNIIDRGYTGHEHLQSVGLIHMNGRLYDPALRRFLSPDNFVQDPYNTQNFDRYSYVYNNPLLYTDPSGEIAFLPILYAGLKAVAFAVTLHAIDNAVNGVPIWYGIGKTATISFAQGIVSFGIGGIANSFTGASKVFFQAGSHAITGGAFSSISGGNFLSGLATGAVSSLSSSGIDKLHYSDGVKNALIIASGGISGGFASTIAGGDFWSGLRQGLIVAGFNHIQHKFVKPVFEHGDDDIPVFEGGELGEVLVIGKKRNNNFFATALRAYKNSYNPAYSPYNADAFSISVGFGVSAIFFHANVNLQLAVTGGDFSILGGGNSGVGINLHKIGFGPSASMNWHKNYGGNTDVLEGLTGSDVTTSANLILGGSYSTSIETNSKKIPTIINGQPKERKYGVKSYGVNLGAGIGYEKSITKSYEIFRLSK